MKLANPASAGSSPHVRGALELSDLDVLELGIIPACAGSTPRWWIGSVPSRDHPRMCGEHGVPASYQSASAGSSPHVRGAPRVEGLEPEKSGIIPACAGSTPQMTHSISITWDHPRMCGEHIVKHVRPCSKRGSSPHVRGARIPSQRQGRLSGIIPACAGSTPTWVRLCASNGDHPRMCGEHRSIVGIGVACQGSSPHVRGALLHLRVDARDRGIIPACAGSTHHESDGADDERDHPRMCGEHFQTKRARIRLSGSSPHVRGAPHLMAELRGQSGIIPACAGSTALISINSPVSRDHPRMCGEHAVAVRVFPYSWGSSPHVRGAPKGRSGSKDGTGIIPACAGSTPRWWIGSVPSRDHPRMCGEHTSKTA